MAFTPPTTDLAASRMMIPLPQINLNGMIYSTGTIEASGTFSAYGSLLAQGGFIGPEHFEVWYDDRFALGQFQNLPAIIPLPGSWYERY